jgi:hypothetical protein
VTSFQRTHTPPPVGSMIAPVPGLVSTALVCTRAGTPGSLIVRSPRVSGLCLAADIRDACLDVPGARRMRIMQAFDSVGRRGSRGQAIPQRGGSGPRGHDGTPEIAWGQAW